MFITEVERLRETAARVAASAKVSFGLYDDKYRREEIVALGRDLNKYNSRVRKDAFIEDIHDGLLVVVQQAESLLSNLRNEKIHAIMAESLETKHALALEFINVAEFFTETARVTLITVAEYENTALAKKDLDSTMELYYQENFTTANIAALAEVIAYFKARKRDDVITDIYKLPPIKVEDSVLKTVMNTQGSDALDPSGITLLGIFHIINPIFYIWAAQNVWSEIKLKWMELIDDELTYLETRHLELQELQRNGDSSKGTERMIKRYQTEIQVKRTRLRRVRRSLGDGDE